MLQNRLTGLIPPLDRKAWSFCRSYTEGQPRFGPVSKPNLDTSAFSKEGNLTSLRVYVKSTRGKKDDPIQYSSLRADLFRHQPKSFHAGTFCSIKQVSDIVEQQVLVGLNE